MPTRPPWQERNYVTQVVLPALFAKKEGQRPMTPPEYPKLDGNQVCLTWIGHASFLIQTASQNILLDPNWANWLAVLKRVRYAGMEIHHLPNIDLVLITHAHFDHLNRRSLRRIAQDQPIIVPAGVSPLVHNLGFEHVHEMQWWDRHRMGDLQITFTPAKHWGARRVIDTQRGYGGFLIEHHGRRVYACGDSAWFDGFKEIGARLHPQIALLPIGAYDNPSGKEHHINPEEAIQAFRDLGAETLIPMHYGTYRMTYEPVKEPPQRLLRAARNAGCLDKVHILTEGIPQVF
ncbi:MAG: MBL fold metallo-hydrolase [Verrucomicrobiota bacterium]